MKSINEVEEGLRNVASAQGLTGDNVELLIKMLSNVYRDASAASYVNTLESDPDLAKNINSLLNHGKRNMYSLGRGRNCTLKINCQVVADFNINKYDQVYSDKKVTIYYVGDTISLNSRIGESVELEFLVAKDLKELTTKPDSQNHHSLEFITNNISEEYIIYEGDNSRKTTKQFGTHIESSDPQFSDEEILLDMTIPNYGLRLYAGKEFDELTDYTIKYFEFSDSIPEMADLKKIQIRGLLIENHETDITIVEPTPRETMDSALYSMKRSMAVQSRVRSNSDLSNLLMSLFPIEVLDAFVEFDNLNNETILNYIPAKIADTGNYRTLTLDQEEEYISHMMYYVSPNVKFTPCNTDSHIVPLTINTVITISKSIDTEEFKEIILSYEGKLGHTIKASELMGRINKLEGVIYCDLEIRDKDDEVVTEMTVENHQHFDLIEKLSFSYRK